MREFVWNLRFLNDYFIPEPTWVSKNRQPVDDLSRGDIDVLVKIQLCISETAQINVEFTFLSD